MAYRVHIDVNMKADINRMTSKSPLLAKSGHRPLEALDCPQPAI